MHRGVTRKKWSCNMLKHQRILFMVSKTTSDISKHYESGTAPLYHSSVVTSLNYDESYPILLVKSSSVSNSWREQLSILIPRALLTCWSSSWAKRWLWVVTLKNTKYVTFKPLSYKILTWMRRPPLASNRWSWSLKNSSIEWWCNFLKYTSSITSLSSRAVLLRRMTASGAAVCKSRNWLRGRTYWQIIILNWYVLMTLMTYSCLPLFSLCLSVQQCFQRNMI